MTRTTHGAAAHGGPGPWPLRIASAVALLGSCLWAFWPLGPSRLGVPEIGVAAEAPAEPASPVLDVAAFNAPLWVAPPTQPPPPPAPSVVATPPPPPPLKWQLLAIVREGDAYKALVYDPDADKVLTLAEGDHAGPRRVARITPTSVDVRDGAGVRTLALREQAGGRP